MRNKILSYTFLILLLPSIVYAHGEVESKQVLDPVNFIFYASIILFAGVLISLVFTKRLKQIHKKFLFIAITVPVLLSTFYIAGSTVYLNIISESRGPVHWHADYQLLMCGQKILLKGPDGFDNKVGTAVVHHHNEGESLDGVYRVHVEGVLIKLKEASLEHFFEAIGGQLTDNSLTVSLKDGKTKTWKNGDVCENTGKPGKLRVLVNDREIEHAPEYIISKYSSVPPGDFIKLVFD